MINGVQFMDEQGQGLLKARNELLAEILRVTQVTKLKAEEGVNAEEAAENYSALMDKRAPMLEKLGELDRSLRALGVTNPANDIEALALVKEIIALDETQREIALTIIDQLKLSIRGINEGRNMSQVYHTDYIDSGSLFDKKK